jgi:GNAT superfamily N-acetyltransferase
MDADTQGLLTRTYVIEDPQNESRIIGFYTLIMTQVDLEKHKFSTTGGLIARLAVDKKYKNNGFGEWLLIDGLKKLLQVKILSILRPGAVYRSDTREKLCSKYPTRCLLQRDYDWG